MSTTVMFILVAITEGLLHYGLRRDALGKDLPRPAAYILGTLAMMVPFTVWLVERNYMEIAWALWGVLSAGGASVMFWYGLDWLRLTVVSLREMREREKAALTGIQEVLKEQSHVEKQGE